MKGSKRTDSGNKPYVTLERVWGLHSLEGEERGKTWRLLGSTPETGIVTEEFNHSDTRRHIYGDGAQAGI